MLLKYFYNQKLAHASYMVGCQALGEAIVIDPGRDIDLYQREAKANDMQIVGAVETHIHADYVSGARELAAQTNAKLYLSDEGDADWKYQFAAQHDHQLVKDGDTFSVGNIRFEVMHTPGHTPEHISLIITDGANADQPMGIFTGDFVFVGSTGRPDLLEKAAGIAGTAELGAQQMYQSLQRFKQLPDYLQVWPAHGAGSACGKGLGSIPSTTVGYEKLFNPMLQIDDEGVFTQTLLDGQPESPKYFAQMKKVNKAGPRILQDMLAPEWLPANRLPGLLQARSIVVDTRPAAQFSQRHLPGTINIPASMLAAWAGWLVKYDQPFYMVIDAEKSATALADLAYIGLDNVGGLFHTDVIDTLGGEGQALQSYAEISPQNLQQLIGEQEVTLIDVRNDAEWAEERIPNARHYMLGYLADHADEIANGKPIAVHCRSGARSAVGASVLKAHGAKEVINMTGGILAWQAAGLPVTN